MHRHPAPAQGELALLLPVACIVWTAADGSAPSRTVAVDAIGAEDMGVDIGPQSVKRFAERTADAKTVVWNGPMGVFEIDQFAQGTLEVARAVANSSALSIVGGGDSVAAVHKAGVDSKISHISTGGGASLEFLSGLKLPGVEALTDK